MDEEGKTMNILNSISAPKKIVISKDKPVAQVVENKNYKPDILDRFSDKVVNKRDITDTVTMPRAIFKGYLCFTAGTAINAIAGMLKKNTFTKGMSIAGSLISIYGTFNFVKPFLFKENSLTKTEK